MKNNTCCFLGHRNINQNQNQELKDEIYKTIERLVIHENVDTLLFGSKSQFDQLCLEIATEIKEKYPHIKRVYVRAEYPVISKDYENYLLKEYEETYYPEKLLNSGRAVYVQRFFEMINKSQFCVFYYNPKEAPDTRKSGTKIAFDYAVKKNKRIIKLPK